MPSDYDEIRGDNIREYGKGTRHLSFLGRLYTDRTHFIFEVLQNAEDAGASRILFWLFNDRLEVTHNGRHFNELDVRGVCGVGEGTKADDLTQIGKFGIGFKSVYAYTSTPEVHSGDEHFRIEHYVRPYPAESKESGDSWTTLFSFTFDVPTVDAETAYHQIAVRLRNLSARTLLFLQKIKEIEYKLPDGTSGVYLREEVPRGPGRQVTVIGQNKGEEEDENWLVFEKPVPVPDSDYSVKVEVAFKLDTVAKEKTERITRIKDAPLVVYFPTEKSTRFGFLIQGPYRTTPSRDNIPKEDDWNATLVEETAALLIEALLSIKEMGLLTVSLLESMPIRMDDFPEDSMFYPIVEAVREALMDQELLPTDDGTFVSGRNAKLARGAELRKLLTHGQLRELFDCEDDIKWLSGDITQDRTADLRSYLIHTLEIEEIGPDVFARRIEEHFLARQPDEWIIDFYGFLSGQEALWRAALWPWHSTEILRNKPFIRTERDRHIVPFRLDGSANVYLPPEGETDLPLVKTEIAQNEKALDFLKKLGLAEPDVVAEVIETVVPRYRGDESKNISDEDHRRDISRILYAFRTDSQEKKERLISELKELPFIRAVNAVSSDIRFCKPQDIYLRSEDLEMYFQENSEAWFVINEYDDSSLELFRGLGICNRVRVNRREIDARGYVIVWNSHGYHQRGLDGFDPDCSVDGLEHALQQITEKKACYIWNVIARSHVQCIRGILEFSTRQTYEASEKREEFSKMGELLHSHDWLPGQNGQFRRPGEIGLDDLPGIFIRDEKLADQLGMKKDVIAKLAEEAGIPTEDIDLLRKYPEEFGQWKAQMAERNEKPEFPTRTVKNPERRQERLSERLVGAPEKEYEEHEGSVRTTRETIDPDIWLRDQYTNETGQMICQICKGEMPFRKRDGEYYFESVEALSREHFHKEHEAQFLALCPLCAAMYKEFVKRDEEAMLELKNAFMHSDDLEIPMRLGELDRSIRFVETHYHDIKTILGEQE